MPKIFSTRLLDNSLKRKKQENEKRRKAVLEVVFLALDNLSKIIHFDKAYIFGSVAKKNKFSGRSDVDIGFWGLGNEDVIKAAAFLSREIGLDVDVVQLENHKLAQEIKGGIAWKKAG